MLQSTIVHSTEDLKQILRLQKENLPENIGDIEMRSEGFVTIRHDLNTLEQMHRLAPSVIIKNDDRVIAYALTMLKECRQLIPDLEPMFALFDKLNWKNKPLKDYHFYVMGQICIAKAFRGQGLFEQLYQQHKKIYNTRYDLFITEISVRNHRSLRAHKKVGFKQIHTHQDELDKWEVVAWDWS
jgi:hypothetical protein